MNVNVNKPFAGQVARRAWNEYLNKYDADCKIINIFDVAGDVFERVIKETFLWNVHKYNGIADSLEDFLRIARNDFGDYPDDKLMALMRVTLKVLDSEKKNWKDFWKDVARALYLEDEFFKFFWPAAAIEWACGSEGEM